MRTVEVTQADRDAAMQRGVAVGYTARTKAKVLRGDKDEDDLVQAFARHRIASVEQAIDAMAIAPEVPAA